MANENNGVVNPGSAGSGADGSNINTNTNANGGGQQSDSGGNGGGGNEKVYTYKEDRSDWLPRHRSDERVAKLQQKYDSEISAIRKQLDDQSNRVKSVFGLETPDPKEAERELLRKEILGLIKPEDVIGMTKEEIEELKRDAVAARGDRSRGWQRHAGEMLTAVENGIAEAISSEKLTPTQQKRIRVAYLEECRDAVRERQAARQRGERETVETVPGDEDFLARHEAGDKTLIDEFVKSYLGDWFEPARRTVTAQIVRRNRPVPSGDRTAPVKSTEPQIDYKNEDQWKEALVKARRERLGG